MDPKCYCKVTETEATIMTQIIKPTRKKVIIEDNYNNQIHTFSLTQEQIDLLKTFVEYGLICCDLEWRIVNEEDWKEI